MVSTQPGNPCLQSQRFFHAYSTEDDGGAVGKQQSSFAHETWLILKKRETPLSRALSLCLSLSLFLVELEWIDRCAAGRTRCANAHWHIPSANLQSLSEHRPRVEQRLRRGKRARAQAFLLTARALSGCGTERAGPSASCPSRFQREELFSFFQQKKGKYYGPDVSCEALSRKLWWGKKKWGPATQTGSVVGSYRVFFSDYSLILLIFMWAMP